jgi:hypothetical protein
MKTYWLLLALLSGTTLHAFQGTTPQAALEELATATEPETIARHLPESIQENLDTMPRDGKKFAMNKLLEIKESNLGGYIVRQAQDGDGWELIDSDGAIQGKARTSDAFFSGMNALLPVEIKLRATKQVFWVAMHLEDNEWRIDDFGQWEKNDLNLAKLLHQPTQMEKNEAAARETLHRLRGQLQQYASSDDILGYPSSLKVLTEAEDDDEPVLDASFAADPFIKDGYEFRYIRTNIGDGTGQNVGAYEIRATPVEFNKTGSKNYYCNQFGIHMTDENRPAASNDPTTQDQVVISLD